MKFAVNKFCANDSEPSSVPYQALDVLRLNLMKHRSIVTTIISIFRFIDFYLLV